MKQFLRNLADVLDGLTAIAAAGSICFVLYSFKSLETGPEFMQIGLFSLMLPVIPYCLAGAVHRIWQRFPAD
jgi:hypothetical protein